MRLRLAHGKHSAFSARTFSDFAGIGCQPAVLDSVDSFLAVFQALIARRSYGGSMQDCGGNRYAALPPQASLGFGVE